MRVPLATLALLLAAGCAPDGTPPAGVDTPAPDARVDTPPADAPATTGTLPDATASTGIPERFRGTWAANAAACATPGHESGFTIGASEATFYESAGPVTAVAVDGNRLQATFHLTGEGETWEATYAFDLSADGNTLTDVDGGMVRQRCR